MRLGDGFEIVGLVGMGAHRIGQRRVDCCGPEVGADHGSLRVAAKRANVFQRHLARLHPRARHHRTERVENPVLAFAQHLFGQLLIACGDHVAGETLSHAGPRREGRAAASCSQSGNGAGGLKETAA